MCVPWELNPQPLCCWRNALPLSHGNTIKCVSLCVTCSLGISCMSSWLFWMYLSIFVCGLSRWYFRRAWPCICAASDEFCLTHDSHCLIHSVTDVTHPVCEAGMSWHVGLQTASRSAASLLYVPSTLLPRIFLAPEQKTGLQQTTHGSPEQSL